MTNSIGVDIGGTKISAAYIVDHDIVAVLKRSYNRKNVVSDVAQMYAELTAEYGPSPRLGVSCAGLVDSSTGTVRFAGNLQMDKFQLGPELEQIIDVPVKVENDARCALWGEFSKSNGSLGTNVAGLVLGTGVGGGLIINSELVVGKNGFAGEFGHLPVRNSNRLCACGLTGCLESVAGGRSFEESFQAKTGKSLTGEELAIRARASDSQALEAFKELGLAIGEVIAQIDTAMDLDSLVIGGGFGNTADLWLETAMDSYAKNLVGSENRSPLQVALSKLGQQAQLLGAGALS